MGDIDDAHVKCPCDTGKLYSACCGRWHDGPQALAAPDALHLMRSRYSAFVLDKLDHLLATWHPDHRPATLSPNAPAVKWLGLTIKSHGALDTDHAHVRFVARYRENGRATRLVEDSRFERIAGRWYYVDGLLQDA